MYKSDAFKHSNPGKEREVLKELATSYLYRDLFSFQETRRPELLQKIVEALALQIGSEVSLNELARTVSADIQTVDRYIGLLEQACVVFRLRSFSRNARTELRKARKIYFYDTGIRNALIANFAPLRTRADAGSLWENYLVAERAKLLALDQGITHCHFWRTVQQQKVDYLEEKDGVLKAYELKLDPAAPRRFPRTFRSAYPDAVLDMMAPDNYLDWLASPVP